MKLTPHNWKKVRCMQAWHLKQQGWAQRQIAEAFGVSEGAVIEWMKRGREGVRKRSITARLPEHLDAYRASSLANCPTCFGMAPKPMAFEDNSGPAAGSPP